MNLRFFLFLIILITNEVGQAQNTIPSLARVTEYLSPVPDFTPLATLNPALQYYHYEYSYTELSLTGKPIGRKLCKRVTAGKVFIFRPVRGTN